MSSILNPHGARYPDALHGADGRHIPGVEGYIEHLRQHQQNDLEVLDLWKRLAAILTDLERRGQVIVPMDKDWNPLSSPDNRVMGLASDRTIPGTPNSISYDPKTRSWG